MFTYFHKNKFLGNKKGQLVPLFIIIIVVLVIMAFVTVNLSKVASIKTESANAADAGAVAGGAVMANVFNAIAQSNSEMEAAFWEFYATCMGLFAIAEGLLLAGLVELFEAELQATRAQTTLNSSCDQVCDAEAKGLLAGLAEAAGKNILTQTYNSAVMAIIITITAYSIATYFHYQLIREMAEKGRKSALKMAYQFAFTNSGIGAKLKEGVPPDDMTDPDSRRNYRTEFSKAMKVFSEEDYEPPSEITYSWKDGQNRSHSVRVGVGIDKVDTFKLKITVLPWEAEEALLLLGTSVVVAFLYSAGAALLMGSCICWACKDIPYVGAFCRACWYVLCYAGKILIMAGLLLNKIAIFKFQAAWAALLIAAAGLTPGPIIRDDSGDVLWATICWIDDVVHNRKVQVDVWQHHEGLDTGLWQTNYPDTYSYSLIDFSGNGKIHPPNIRFDTSIIDTDTIGSAPATPGWVKDCPQAVKELKGMEEEIVSLLAAAEEYDKQALEFEGLVATFQQQGLAQEDINEMIIRAQEARNRAASCRDQADEIEDKKLMLKQDFAQCF